MPGDVPETLPALADRFPVEFPAGMSPARRNAGKAAVGRGIVLREPQQVASSGPGGSSVDLAPHAASPTL